MKTVFVLFDSLNRLISGQDPMGASVEVAIDPVAQQAAWGGGGKVGSIGAQEILFPRVEIEAASS